MIDDGIIFVLFLCEFRIFLLARLSVGSTKARDNKKWKRRCEKFEKEDMKNKKIQRIKAKQLPKVQQAHKSVLFVKQAWNYGVYSITDWWPPRKSYLSWRWSSPFSYLLFRTRSCPLALWSSGWRRGLARLPTWIVGSTPQPKLRIRY